MPYFRVSIEILETHEREIEAVDEDHAEDILRADLERGDLGTGRRRVHFCHAAELESPGGPVIKLPAGEYRG